MEGSNTRKKIKWSDKFNKEKNKRRQKKKKEKEKEQRAKKDR